MWNGEKKKVAGGCLLHNEATLALQRKRIFIIKEQIL